MGVMGSSRRRDSIQASSKTSFATPRYFDLVLDQDTIFCLEDDQETRLELRKRQ